MAFTLDTNILIHLLRDSATAKKVAEKFFIKENPTLIISIVTQGEIESIALQNGYGEKKLNELKKLFTEFLVIPVNDKEIVDRYAEIDAYSQGKFSGKSLPSGISSRNMGKNDLWIAATASLTKTTLLTTDGDFDHLIGCGYLEIEKVERI